MEYTNMSFLYDFAFMSLLLIIAQFLRSRIKFLQMFYIPASVLAGLMGLVLGPQFLNVIPWSGKIGSYAYMLQMVHGRSVPCRSAALPPQSVLPAERMYCQSSLP